MLRIIAVLLLIPLLDVLLLVAVGTWLGWVPTILLVVLSALLGLLLVRAEGRHTLRKIQVKLADGEVPTDELLDGGLLLISGTMMLLPGLVTDLFGLLLVIPFTRYPFRLALKKWVVTPYVDAKASGFATGNVYTAGFPGGDGGPQGAAGSGGSGSGPGHGPGPGAGSGSGDTYDVDEDDYEIDFGDDESR